VDFLFSTGVYLAMKGHLRFRVKPLRAYVGKRFDNDLNMVNTIKQVKPKYRFEVSTYEEYIEWVGYNLFVLNKALYEWDIKSNFYA